MVSGIMSPRISMVDVASLFGRVVKGKFSIPVKICLTWVDNGRIRIEADYDGHVPMDITEDYDDASWDEGEDEDPDVDPDYDSELDD